MSGALEVNEAWRTTESENLGTFSLFVSSTFTDFTQEREILEEEIFPRLTDYAARFGLAFEAVDLRWGVTRTDVESNRILNVCLEEVTRCRAAMTKPSFLVMLGDRYGWMPPIERMPEPVLDTLIGWAREDSEGDAKALIDLYSLRDSDAIPVMALLRPASQEDQQRAVRILHRLSPRLRESEPVLAELMISSATEYEIWASVLADQDGGHAVWVDRRISAEELGHSVDSPFRDPEKNGAQSNPAERLGQLRTKLEDCPGLTRHAFEGISIKEIHDPGSGYARSFTKKVEQSLVEQIDQWVKGHLETGVNSSQRNFAAVRARGIDCRREEIDRLDRMVEAACQQTDSPPILVHGDAGSGVTSLLAKWAQQSSRPVFSWFPEAVGANNWSDMKKGFWIEADQLPEESDRVVESPHGGIEKLLLRASRVGGGVVLIDDICSVGGWTNLQYPTLLPEGTALIISTSSDEAKSVGSLAFHETLAIKSLGADDATRIANQTAARPHSPWFGELDRQSHGSISGEDGHSIGGALALGEAWRRGGREIETPEKAISFLVEMAESIHGESLVRASLSLLHACEETGITAKEARAALLLDPDVVQEMESRSASGEAPVAGFLPLASWARLIAPFSWGIRSEARDGERVLSLGASGLRDGVEARYLWSEGGLKGKRFWLGIFLEFLRGESDLIVQTNRFGSNRNVPNRRKLNQLNRLMLTLGLTEEVASRCLDLTTIEDRLLAAQGAEAGDELIRVIKELEEVETGDPAIAETLRVIRQTRSAFERHPGAFVASTFSRLGHEERATCLKRMREEGRRAGAKMLVPDTETAKAITRTHREGVSLVLGGWFPGLSIDHAGNVQLMSSGGKSAVCTPEGIQLERQNRLNDKGLWLRLLRVSTRSSSWIGEVKSAAGLPHYAVVSGLAPDGEFTEWTGPVREHLESCSACKEGQTGVMAQAISVSPDGRLGAVSLRCHTLVCDLEEGSVVCEVPHLAPVGIGECSPHLAVFSDEGSRLYIESRNGMITEGNIPGGETSTYLDAPQQGILLFVGGELCVVSNSRLFIARKDRWAEIPHRVEQPIAASASENGELAISSVSEVVLLHADDLGSEVATWTGLRVLPYSQSAVLKSGEVLVSVSGQVTEEVLRLTPVDGVPESRVDFVEANRIEKIVGVTGGGLPFRVEIGTDRQFAVRTWSDDKGVHAIEIDDVRYHRKLNDGGAVLHRLVEGGRDVALPENLDDLNWIHVPKRFGDLGLQPDSKGQVVVGLCDGYQGEGKSAFVIVPSMDVEKTLDGRWDICVLSPSGDYLMLTRLLREVDVFGDKVCLLRALNPRKPDEVLWETKIPHDPMPISWFTNDERFGFGAKGWIRISDGATFTDDFWGDGPISPDGRRGASPRGGDSKGSLYIDLTAGPERISEGFEMPGETAPPLNGEWPSVFIKDCVVQGICAGDGAFYGTGVSADEFVVGSDPLDQARAPWQTRLHWPGVPSGLWLKMRMLLAEDHLVVVSGNHSWEFELVSL